MADFASDNLEASSHYQSFHTNSLPRPYPPIVQPQSFARQPNPAGFHAAGGFKSELVPPRLAWTPIAPAGGFLQAPNSYGPSRGASGNAASRGRGGGQSGGRGGFQGSSGASFQSGSRGGSQGGFRGRGRGGRADSRPMKHVRQMQNQSSQQQELIEQPQQYQPPQQQQFQPPQQQQFQQQQFQPPQQQQFQQQQFQPPQQQQFQQQQFRPPQQQQFQQPQQFQKPQKQQFQKPKKWKKSQKQQQQFHQPQQQQQFQQPQPQQQFHQPQPQQQFHQPQQQQHFQQPQPQQHFYQPKQKQNFQQPQSYKQGPQIAERGQYSKKQGPGQGQKNHRQFSNSGRFDRKQKQSPSRNPASLKRHQPASSGAEFLAAAAKISRVDPSRADFDPMRDGFTLPENAPESFKQMVESNWCSLCQTGVNSVVTAEVHYNGKTHQRMLCENGLPAGPYYSGVLNTGNSETPELPAGLDTHYCKLCNVTFTNTVQMFQHYAGKKHRANSRNEQLVQQAERAETVIFHCAVCGIFTNTQESLDSHLNGMKHKAVLEMQAKAAQNAGPMATQTAGSSAAQTPGSSANQAAGSSANQAAGSSANQAAGSSANQAAGSSANQAAGSSANQAAGSSANQAAGSSTNQASESSANQAAGSSANQAAGSSANQATGSSAAQTAGSSAAQTANAGSIAPKSSDSPIVSSGKKF